ncbi:hypothetical protein [Motiliproteus sp. MSK22-1]|uniref:hypothetical protein n=1 Tax=Motiliproteus sp. MSK22-1 TaxID=1897630 RepID=UPI000976F491|nr:hypothetical protein [Motiliproteus sp. MSK22-1]OMH27997.1 hypothetical protein BGP75_21710 [Motiliproteus sp. MSK22-1]
MSFSTIGAIASGFQTTMHVQLGPIDRSPSDLGPFFRLDICSAIVLSDVHPLSESWLKVPCGPAEMEEI